MRLLSIKKYLKDQLEKLPANFDKIENLNGYYYIYEWNTIHKILINLYEIDFLEPAIHDVLIFYEHYDPTKNHLKFNNELLSLFRRSYKILISGMNMCISMLDSNIKDDEENQLNVLIPNNISLEEIEKIFNDLDFIFNNCNIIRNVNEGEDVQISKIDSGSIIVALSVAGGAVSLIGGLVNICYKVHLSRLEKKKLNKEIENLDLDLSIKEKVLEAYTRKAKDDNYILADNFVKDNDIKADKEDINSLGLGIGRIINLIEKNVFIVPSSKAAEETKKLFPTQEETPKFPYEILLLEQPNNKEITENVNENQTEQ